MLHPILGELVAHEQHTDRVREAGQRRLAKAAIAGQPRGRFELPTAVGTFLLFVRRLFTAPALPLGPKRVQPVAALEHTAE